MTGFPHVFGRLLFLKNLAGRPADRRKDGSSGHWWRAGRRNALRIPLPGRLQ
jgi:hypothetical protein